MYIVPHTFKNCLDGLFGEYWKNGAKKQYVNLIINKKTVIH